jgi:hypothetical protein
MSTIQVNVTSANTNFILPALTVAQRQALTPSTGQMIYNSDWDTVEFYDGTNWLDASILT